MRSHRECDGEQCRGWPQLGYGMGSVSPCISSVAILLVPHKVSWIELPRLAGWEDPLSQLRDVRRRREGRREHCNMCKEGGSVRRRWQEVRDVQFLVFPLTPGLDLGGQGIP